MRRRVQNRSRHHLFVQMRRNIAESVSISSFKWILIFSNSEMWKIILLVDEVSDVHQPLCVERRPAHEEAEHNHG